jgi:tetratricopeptide (TPR) repeat protein
MDGRLTAAASPAPPAEPSSSPSPSSSVAASNSAATLVARAADEYLERLAAGETPDVAEFARRYPQVAGVLPQVLPALELLRTLAPPVPALGEFRILREIGRGGMGVVYEAVQISLGRRVALKVLPASGMVDARSLTRFQVEAQVMAALHHPHIVPIFAVGCDRGMHYYAMQLIEGCSLAERLREAGQERLVPREAARLAMQAAEALEHAHGLGILHRDIKPGNLLVDVQGHVWVTDFGLARLEGAGDGPGSGDLTDSGDRPGTLRYMSPEQAAGGRVLDPRADVYSLGATLYELLVGRPAFGGTDHAELLRRIAHYEPVPPRRLDPAIPRDLETIVSKAMAKEPERRYDTARELAEDLGRFLDDRPILARRPGPIERLGRLPRRHRRATAAAAALLVLAVLASAFGMARLWQEQRRTHDALLKAQDARRHEREALLFTFTASDRVADRALVRIASAADPKDPAELARDRDFCRAALGYYEEIAGRYRRDVEMQPIVAAADHRIGFIRMILGEPGAEDAHRRSIALYEALLAASPRDAMLRSAMARTYADLILLLRRTGRAGEVLDCFPPLLELRRRLADDFPGDSANLVSLTLLQAEYAGLLEVAGRADEAARVRRQLEDIYRLAIGREPLDPAACNNLAWLVVSRPEAIRHDPARAVELAKQAVAMAPSSGTYRNTLGVAHYRAGEWSAAVDALAESMRLRSGGDPYDWLFLAMARKRLGDAAEARRWLDRSLSWIEANAPRNEELIRFRAEAVQLFGPDMPPAAKRGEDHRVAG